MVDKDTRRERDSWRRRAERVVRADTTLAGWPLTEGRANGGPSDLISVVLRHCSRRAARELERACGTAKPCLQASVRAAACQEAAGVHV